jgi:hypothetical protein
MEAGNMIKLAKTTALALGLCFTLAARAVPSAGALQEIDYLLRFVEESGCAFNRNGTWHDAKAARAHIRMKYEYILAQDGINTAEDFIDKAATKSSMLFGQPYTVKCDGDQPLRSSTWLGAELARYRALRP